MYGPGYIGRLDDISENDTIDFESVRGHDGMRRKRRWHLLVIAGGSYLQPAEY